MPACYGGRLPERLTGEGYLVDDRLASVVACEGAATRHATLGGTAWRHGCRGEPRLLGHPPGADTATPPRPVESGSSATKRLKCFTNNILRKVPSLLLPQPVVEAQPKQSKLPIHSRRIIA